MVHFLRMSDIKGTVERDALLNSLGCCRINTSVDVCINSEGKEEHTHVLNGRLQLLHLERATKLRSSSLRSHLATDDAIFVFKWDGSDEIGFEDSETVGMATILAKTRHVKTNDFISTILNKSLNVSKGNTVSY